MTRFWLSVRLRGAVAVAGGVLLAVTAPVTAQQAPRPQAANANAPAVQATQADGLVVPADYVIGPEDVLTIAFWKEPDLSGDVPVRPDGRISLPLVNDVDVVGLTVEQLRLKLNKAAAPFLQNDPNVSVRVKQINSRKVYITGMIAKPGAYAHLGPMDVLTLITLAGGLQDFADEKNIVIIRDENGRQTGRMFNYDDVKRGRNLDQNIQLRPGDRVIVPD